MGGVKKRWEYMLMGEPIHQMATAEHYATTTAGVSCVVCRVLEEAEAGGKRGRGEQEKRRREERREERG